MVGVLTTWARHIEHQQSPHSIKKSSGLCSSLLWIYWRVGEVTLIDQSRLIWAYHTIMSYTEDEEELKSYWLKRSKYINILGLNVILIYNFCLHWIFLHDLPVPRNMMIDYVSQNMVFGSGYPLGFLGILREFFKLTLIWLQLKGM